MKLDALKKNYDRYILPTYSKTDVVMVKGKGSWIWDIGGRRYLDFFPGWGVSGLGHCPPRVLNAIRAQVSRIIHVSNNYYQLVQPRLARALSERSFGGKVFFTNSGAEAVEGAIKLSRRFGHSAVAGRRQNRYKTIAFHHSFHGRTLAALSVTGQIKYQQGFDPLLPGVTHVPFNDLEAVRAAIDDQTAAIIVEPIQGEGGIHVARPEFLQGLRALCDEHALLLIFDEVQTGMGRTGDWFAYQHAGVAPDVMTLAKSLGGGVPIGALLVDQKYADLLPRGTHASTFGGSPLVCAAAMAVIETIRRDRLLANVHRQGEALRRGLEVFASRWPKRIVEIRGRGLMLGVELSDPGAVLADRCRQKGLLVNVTQENVLRVMPALNVSAKEIRLGLKMLGETMEELWKSEA